MRALMIKADNALLEQIASIAQNLARKDGKEIKIQSFNDERYQSYEADALAVKRGEIKARPFSEFEKEMEKW
ncbi:MAG: hypothetical protein MR469_05360 [Campylobacter sp.]|uniref:hypothetical protein n=1 Tax=Campylobacter sp. TaxID=205 RepID=UPI002A88816F|nr:hypothetical protein [Campylobacter sp.]MCI6695055.1 hypothetical protein [Campylobacter sp.]MDY4860066.1 hypothetical protein [Campylobacter sp.]